MSTEPFPIASTPARVVFPALGASTGYPSAEHDRGFTQGHAAGYAAGSRAAAAELRNLQQQHTQEHADTLKALRSDTNRSLRILAAAAEACATGSGVVLREAEDALARAAVELAGAILGYELADGERTAKAALARALSGAAAETVTAVRLNPEDLDSLSAAGISGPAGVALVADTAVAPGDALADYPHGWLDARLGAALNRARAALTESQP